MIDLFTWKSSLNEIKYQLTGLNDGLSATVITSRALSK